MRIKTHLNWETWPSPWIEDEHYFLGMLKQMLQLVLVSSQNHAAVDQTMVWKTPENKR